MISIWLDLIQWKMVGFSVKNNLKTLLFATREFLILFFCITWDLVRGKSRYKGRVTKWVIRVWGKYLSDCRYCGGRPWCLGLNITVLTLLTIDRAGRYHYRSASAQTDALLATSYQVFTAHISGSCQHTSAPARLGKVNISLAKLTKQEIKQNTPALVITVSGIKPLHTQEYLKRSAQFSYLSFSCKALACVVERLCLRNGTIYI